MIRFPGCETPFEPLGVGAWSWGDESTWGMGGYDRDLSEGSIAEAWDASIASGVTLVDTAEVYGGGESERIIGRLLRRDPSLRSRLVIASKFWPAPWKLEVSSALRASLEASLERLGIERLDLYQIHGPISLRSHGAMAEALAQVHRDGLVCAVGVSNYSIRGMGAIHAELAARGLPLASNQIEFSLLRRKPETGGLLAACERLGVVPIAYSPIGQGRLTGKYSATNPPPGRRNFSRHPMERVDPIVEELRRIGERCAGEDGPRTPSQVALRWLIDKGAVAIPGAKNASQATQNAGALGWTLSSEQMAALDRVALVGEPLRSISSIANRIWQHG